MPILILFAIIILVIWAGWHIISWIVGGLVDITGGWINLLVLIAVTLIIWHFVIKRGER